MCDNSIHCFIYHSADEFGRLDYAPEVHTKRSHIKINEPIHFQRALREKGLNFHSRWHYLFHLKNIAREKKNLIAIQCQEGVIRNITSGINFGPSKKPERPQYLHFIYIQS